MVRKILSKNTNISTNLVFFFIEECSVFICLSVESLVFFTNELDYFRNKNPFKKFIFNKTLILNTNLFLLYKINLLKL